MVPWEKKRSDSEESEKAYRQRIMKKSMVKYMPSRNKPVSRYPEEVRPWDDDTDSVSSFSDSDESTLLKYQTYKYLRQTVPYIIKVIEINYASLETSRNVEDGKIFEKAKVTVDSLPSAKAASGKDSVDFKGSEQAEDGANGIGSKAPENAKVGDVGADCEWSEEADGAEYAVDSEEENESNDAKHGIVRKYAEKTSESEDSEDFSPDSLNSE